MNVEEQYRTALEHATDEQVGGPDLAVSLAAGRRRRARRTVVRGGAVGVVGLAVAAVATGVTVHQLQRPTAVAVSPADRSASHDFVPGSDVDESLQATVAAHLSGLSSAEHVFPSDWNHIGPDPDALPDDQAANATEWQAWYSPSGHDEVLVRMSKAIPGYPLDPKCTEIVPSEGAPPCSVTDLSGGGQVARYGTFGADLEVPPLLHPYSFMTLRTNADGSFVMVREQVAADSWAQAAALRSVTDDQALALVDDPTMTFPDPVVVPADPKGP